MLLWVFPMKLAGVIRDRGLFMMAVGGNMVTAFYWFGLNMLGVGLHSYGFMDKAFWGLLGFLGSQALLIVLAAVSVLARRKLFSS